MRVPPLETRRLIIRPFALADLDAVYQLLDVDLSAVEFGNEGAMSRDERKQWLRWAVLNYDELAKLYQPPYGDRAVVLKQSGQLIGVCGFVPSMGPFGLLPELRTPGEEAVSDLSSPEFGLFYAFSPAYQRRGYATEAARALIDYAFAELRLKRVVATTTYDNLASIGVMRKLGMHIAKNPYLEPAWFQIVGILENRK